MAKKAATKTTTKSKNLINLNMLYQLQLIDSVKIMNLS